MPLGSVGSIYKLITMLQSLRHDFISRSTTRFYNTCATPNMVNTIDEKMADALDNGRQALADKKYRQAVVCFTRVCSEKTNTAPSKQSPISQYNEISRRQHSVHAMVTEFGRAAHAKISHHHAQPQPHSLLNPVVCFTKPCIPFVSVPHQILTGVIVSSISARWICVLRRSRSSIDWTEQRLMLNGRSSWRQEGSKVGCGWEKWQGCRKIGCWHGEYGVKASRSASGGEM